MKKHAIDGSINLSETAFRQQQQFLVYLILKVTKNISLEV